MESEELRALGIDCSPTGPGRTANAISSVLAAAGGEAELIHLGGKRAVEVEEAVARMNAADVFVFGSPIYRATFATPFKALIDATPRGMWGETEAPLTGRAVALVATGASDHHFLGLGRMRDALVDFFAAHVVSPGLYVSHDGFGEDRELVPELTAAARIQGLALSELGRAVAGSEGLGSVTPQA